MQGPEFLCGSDLLCKAGCPYLRRSSNLLPLGSFSLWTEFTGGNPPAQAIIRSPFVWSEPFTLCTSLPRVKGIDQCHLVEIGFGLRQAQAGHGLTRQGGRGARESGRWGDPGGPLYWERLLHQPRDFCINTDF